MFWLLGAVVLSILPALVKDHLGGGAGVVTFVLGAFSVGVGLGAVLCERLSYEQIELGLVPLGALGLSVFLAALGWVSGPLASQAGSGRQSSSVKAITDPRAFRQPALRAAAGPCLGPTET